MKTDYFYIIVCIIGCHKQIAKKVGGQRNLDVLYDTFGSNIYLQMMNNVKKLYKHIFKKDDVAEALGIVGCFRMDVLRLSLKWINKNGCIHIKTKTGNGMSKRYDSLIGKAFHVLLWLWSHIRTLL